MWGGPVPKEITIFGQNAFCKYWLGGKMSHKNVLIIVKFHRRWLKDRATVHPFRRYCGTILTTLLWVYVPTKKIFWNTLPVLIYFWREREAINLIIRLIVRQQCRQYKHPTYGIFVSAQRALVAKWISEIPSHPPPPHLGLWVHNVMVILLQVMKYWIQSN